MHAELGSGDGGRVRTIIMDTRTEFATQKKIIEGILEKSERARNDDKWLTYLLLRHYTKVFIPFEDFKKIPAFANAQKIRQRIQNKEKRFLPTDPKVRQKRGVRNSEIREIMVE